MGSVQNGREKQPTDGKSQDVMDVLLHFIGKYFRGGKA